MTASKSNHYDVPQEKNNRLPSHFFRDVEDVTLRRPSPRRDGRNERRGDRIAGLTDVRTDTVARGSVMNDLRRAARAKSLRDFTRSQRVPKSPSDDDIIGDDVILEFQTCPRACFQNQKTEITNAFLIVEGKAQSSENFI